MKWKHKSWVTIWLILVCAALVVTGTYAAYTKVEYVKRVVATKKMAQMELFSSNHLLLRSDGNDYPLRMVPVGTQSNVSVMVSVCNYLQSDITRFNDETITYTFSAQLVDLQGNVIGSNTQITYETGEGTKTITGSQLAGIIQIKKSGTAVQLNVTADSITYSLSGETLAGGVESANFYEISCPKENIPVLDAIAIQMKADPGVNQKKLVGELWLGTGYQQLTAWNGRFVGLPVSDDGSTVSHDAFNYEIYGTKQQKLKVYWNPNKVTLGKWSREQFTGATVGTENGYKYIEIDVGAPGTPMSYTLQFYRVSSILDSETASDVRGTSAQKGYVYIGQ